MTDTIGFIGLGAMGMGQALSLARGGRPVLVYDSDPAAMARAAEQDGITAADSPRAVAEGSAVVFTCLPDDAAVGQVFRGEAGILQGAREGLLTCDLSTVSPGFTAALDAELRSRGVSHFTAPMLGSKPQADTGEVFYMVGGDAARMDKLAPLLEISGRMHIHVGTPENANKIKLLHNALGSVNYAAVAESLALCLSSGVDLKAYYEVVRNGGGMAFSNYFDRKVPHIIAGDYEPRFKLKLAHKDSGLAKAMFEGLGVPAPIHDHARAMLDEAMNDGLGEEDASAITRNMEKRIGRKIRQS
ncbi:MAG: NAD(P)-dependent oxidoreductase [SAR324 cluster bacterium]|nr:NAD(P)-dependent oxidoreductase [SAR324 cluster bacterium]